MKVGHPAKHNVVEEGDNSYLKKLLGTTQETSIQRWYESEFLFTNSLLFFC